MAINQKSRWDDIGVEPPAGEAKYTAGEQPIAEYDNWFNKAVVDDIAALDSAIDEKLDKSGGTVDGNLTINGVLETSDIQPRLNNTYKIGLSTMYYAEAYITQIFSDLLKPESTASKIGLPDAKWKELHVETVYADYVDVASAKSLIAASEEEVTTTSTTYETVKEFKLAKLASVYNDWREMTVLAELQNAYPGHIAYLGVFIDGNLMGEIACQEDAPVYTLKGLIIDISGLGDGVHTVEIMLKSSDSLYQAKNRLLEVWVR